MEERTASHVNVKLQGRNSDLELGGSWPGRLAGQKINGYSGRQTHMRTAVCSSIALALSKQQALNKSKCIIRIMLAMEHRCCEGM